MEWFNGRQSLSEFTERGEKVRSKTKHGFFKKQTYCNLGLTRGQYFGLIAFLSSMERSSGTDVLGKANQKCSAEHLEQCF